MSAQDDTKTIWQKSRLTRRRFVAGSTALGLATIAAPRIVRADGGKITLNGTVDTGYERDLVEDAAWSVPGVTQVRDNVTIDW